MSLPQRALGLACRLTVALWIAVYLAWPAASPVAEPPPAPASAHIQPVPEAPPPEPDPEPEPETASALPAPEAAPPLAETVVGRADISQGAALLDGGGAFPTLTCSYEDFRSFRAYARAMESLGARFVVVRSRKIVGGIEIATGALGPARLDGAFSPRARDYTGEPELLGLAQAVRSRFGREAVVMMLVPRSLDAGLFGGIARALSERGDRHGDFREIRGRYQRAPGGGVRLRVDSAVRTSGEEVAVELLFNLTQIARAGEDGAGPTT